MTPKQKETLEFIAEGISKNGYPPTYDELVVSCGVNSKSIISRRIVVLNRQGFVTYEPRVQQSLEVTQKGWDVLMVDAVCPCCGADLLRD